MASTSVRSIAADSLGKTGPLSLLNDIFLVTHLQEKVTLSLKDQLEWIQDFKWSGFFPIDHGFKFNNLDFVNYIFSKEVSIANFRGRCGGMVYVALDYFYAHKPIPLQTKIPEDESPLGHAIWHRWVDDAILPSADRWAELIFNPFGWRTREFYNWGLNERFVELRREIDNRRPAVLGLLNPKDAFYHHYVLAIGYRGSGENLAIQVYDPNYPDEAKVLHPYPHKDNPRYGYNYGQWLTYFVDLNYKKKTPP